MHLDLNINHTEPLYISLALTFINFRYKSTAAKLIVYNTQQRINLKLFILEFRQRGNKHGKVVSKTSTRS
jgi:hypothetical protein